VKKRVTMKNCFLFVFLVFLLNDYCIDGAELGLCSALNFTLKITNPQNIKEIVMVYSGELSLTKFDSFHSNITLSNTHFWSFNETLYYQTGAPVFSDFRGYSDFQCQNESSTCTFTVSDGAMFFYLQVMINGEQKDVPFASWLLMEQATFFGGWFQLDSKSPPCFSGTEGGNYNGHTYCCSKYTTLTVPDSTPDSCQEFSGSTVFLDANDKPFSHVSTNIEVNPNFVNITATAEFLLEDAAKFEINPNYIVGCSGSTSKSCSTLFEITPSKNFQIDNYFKLKDSTGESYSLELVSKIIRRNGIFLKNESHPFTPEDSCLIEMTPTLWDGSKTQNKFCCTKFSTSPEKSDLVAKEMLQEKIHMLNNKVNFKMPKTLPRRKSVIPSLFKHAF
jgi:hypothetical protein